MAASASESLQQRKQQLVREAIWDAAIDLFLEKGYGQTTVDEIARAAGVSRRSFFRYFASVDDLLGQRILDYGTALSAAIHACPAGVPLSEVLRRTVLAIAHEAAAYPRSRKVMQVVASSAAARRAQWSRRPEAEEMVLQAYALRCREGDEVTPGLLAGLTFTVLDVTFRQWFADESRGIGVVADEVLATVAGAVGGTACCQAVPQD